MIHNFPHAGLSIKHGRDRWRVESTAMGNYQIIPLRVAAHTLNIGDYLRLDRDGNWVRTRKRKAAARILERTEAGQRVQKFRYYQHERMSLSTGLAIIFGTLFAVAFGLFLLVSLPFAAIAALIQYRGNLSNYFRRGISSGGIWMRDRVVSAPVIFLLMGALWLIDLRRKIRSP